ncbi:MAG: zinc-binding dehydrogenase [Acutalibacteraceae bacterium]
MVEPIAEKREAALRFGADVVIDPNTQSVVTEALTLSGGIGYDAVIEASGDRKSAAITMNLVARGGSVVFFGLYGMDYNLELNLFTLYWKDATLSAVCVPSGQFPAAIAMAGQLEAGGGHFPRAVVFQGDRGIPRKIQRPRGQGHAAL